MDLKTFDFEPPGPSEVRAFGELRICTHCRRWSSGRAISSKINSLTICFLRFPSKYPEIEI